MSQTRNTREIRKDVKMNETDNTTYYNIWDAEEAMFREKIIDVNACIKKDLN